ncbi:MAG: lipopolysaccharide assembly protein LapA domain-containing protein [Actinomycetota bacterium]
MRREPEDPNDAVPEGKPSFEYRREGAGFKSVALGTAAVLLVIFILQNLEDENIDFLFWDWDVAIALAIGVAAVLGFIIGWSLSWVRRRARKP